MFILWKPTFPGRSGAQAGVRQQPELGDWVAKPQGKAWPSARGYRLPSGTRARRERGVTNNGPVLWFRTRAGMEGGSHLLQREESKRQRSVVGFLSVRAGCGRRRFSSPFLHRPRHEFIVSFFFNTTFSLNGFDPPTPTPLNLAQDHFKQVGHVQFVEIPEDEQGRSKGRATVRFASEQDAANAIHHLNNTELDGRTIYVREDTNP